VLVSPSSLISAALAAAALAAAAAPRAAAKVGLKKVGSFDQPVWVTAPPGDTHRLFVVEKTGGIRVVKNGRKLARPFLSLRGRVTTGAEQGLLSLAFSPDYAKTGRFYIDFTDRQGNSHVTAYRRSRGNPDVASPKTARRGLFQRPARGNHNGTYEGGKVHAFAGFSRLAVILFQQQQHLQRQHGIQVCLRSQVANHWPHLQLLRPEPPAGHRH